MTTPTGADDDQGGEAPCFAHLLTDERDVDDDLDVQRVRLARELAQPTADASAAEGQTADPLT